MKLTMIFETESDAEDALIAGADAKLTRRVGKDVDLRIFGTLEAMEVMDRDRTPGAKGAIADEAEAPTPAPMTEPAAIAAISAIVEQIPDYDARQRVLAWAAQLASQAGVTVS